MAMNLARRDILGDKMNRLQLFFVAVSLNAYAVFRVSKRKSCCWLVWVRLSLLLLPGAVFQKRGYAALGHLGLLLCKVHNSKFNDGRRPIATYVCCSQLNHPCVLCFPLMVGYEATVQVGVVETLGRAPSEGLGVPEGYDSFPTCEEGLRERGLVYRHLKGEHRNQVRLGDVRKSAPVPRETIGLFVSMHFRRYRCRFVAF